MKARYLQRGDCIDFVPARDMDAGEIIRLGSLIGITKNPIHKGEIGSISVNGIFAVQKRADTRIPLGCNVFWNETLHCADSEGTVILGTAVEEALPGSSIVKTFLNYTGTDDEAQWIVL